MSERVTLDVTQENLGLAELLVAVLDRWKDREQDLGGRLARVHRSDPQFVSQLVERVAALRKHVRHRRPLQHHLPTNHEAAACE